MENQILGKYQPKEINGAINQIQLNLRGKDKDREKFHDDKVLN